MIRKLKFLFILVPVVFISVATFATMGLWNWLMPSLFGVGTLTFFKALGVFVLARLLLGGRSWGGWRRRRLAYATLNHSNPTHWQQKMQGKWQNMSTEDRAKFSSRCGNRFNFDKDSNADSTNQ